MNLSQFFRDDVEALSCTRLLAFMVVAVVLGVWAYGCFKAGTYIPMGYAEAGALSAAIGGKVVGGWTEYGGGRA